MMVLVPPADDIATLIGRMLMVGVHGATPNDPLLRADLEACREAGCRAVILFDVDGPTFAARLGAGEQREAAIAASPRNILGPAQTRGLTDHIREAFGPGAIISVDQEGGEVARLSPRRGFACSLSAEAVGAMGDDAIRAEAAAQARMVADAGFNLNFAPCVDVAVNPSNPIIEGKRRAYSADPARVTACAAEVLHAHARAGVASCLKHFPGHGSSEGDSHLGFTDITRTWREDEELAPYRALLNHGGRGAGPSPRSFVMTGHLFHEALDGAFPTSLSRAVTTALLRERLGFTGPVVTDSLDMRAITDRYGAAEACILATNAGADLLLDANNMAGPPRPCPAPIMAEALTRALRDGRIQGGVDRLRASAARIDKAMGFARGA